MKKPVSPEILINPEKLSWTHALLVIAQTPAPFQDKQIRVSISMGASEFKPCLPNFEQLIHEADQALYASKEAGRNRVTCHPLK